MMTRTTAQMEFADYPGTWTVVDQRVIEGEECFLMKHDQAGDNMMKLIVNDWGKVLKRTWQNSLVAYIMDAQTSPFSQYA